MLVMVSTAASRRVSISAGELGARWTSDSRSALPKYIRSPARTTPEMCAKSGKTKVEKTGRGKADVAVVLFQRGRALLVHPDGRAILILYQVSTRSQISSSAAISRLDTHKRQISISPSYFQSGECRKQVAPPRQTCEGVGTSTTVLARKLSRRGLMKWS